MKVDLALLLFFAILLFLIPPLFSSGNQPADTLSQKNSAPVSLPAGQENLEENSQKNEEGPQSQASPDPAEELLSYPVEGKHNFTILDASTGETFTVDYLDYMKGAVCAEMPPDFHSEAMKAQAVSALTYALYLKEENAQNPDESLRGADFSADPSNWKTYVSEEDARERYGDKFEEYWGKIDQAVEKVGEVVLLYEEEPILAAYHSTSSGVTEAAENVWSTSAPYLKPVDSQGDLLAPSYETTATFSAQELKEILTEEYGELNLPDDPYEWMEVIERSQGGYVLSIQVGDLELHGKELRELLSLRSSDFTVTCDGSSFTFTVYGYGHGVGLSQYGADFMARQGSNYEDILKHYYSGVQLARLV